MYFQNPNTKYNNIEKIATPLSWLWVLLFGPFYWAFKGCWRHFSIHLLLGLASYGIIHFLYPFFTYSILRKHHQRMGWVEVSEEKVWVQKHSKSNTKEASQISQKTNEVVQIWENTNVKHLNSDANYTSPKEAYMKLIFTVFDISIKLGMVKKSFFGSLKPTKRQIGWCAGFIDATLQSNNVNDEENRFTTEYIFALVFNNNSYFKDLSKNQDSYHPYRLEGANAYRLFMDSVNLENKKQPIMPPYE